MDDLGEADAEADSDAGDGPLPDLGTTDGGDNCNGVEVDLETDPFNCGECGNICAGATTPDGPLENDACVGGLCQPFWSACISLPYPGATNYANCAEFCALNQEGASCVQDGCGGETLLVFREALGDFFTCAPVETAVELPDYQCADPIPTQNAEPPAVDYFQCCCSDPV